MGKKPLDHFGKLQRAIIEIVWEHGEASVREVWEQLRQKKEMVYTTILTSMQRLERDGWLTHRVDGNKNIYRATKTRAQADAGSVRKFIHKMFNGNAALLFQQLVEEDEISDKELRELKRLIDKKEKERKK
jgi:BlaI family penicillinase repressor